MKSYVITGGTSGIGKQLVESFKNQDVKLFLIVRNLDKARDLYATYPENKIELIHADLENVISLKDAITNACKGQSIDGFINCAGIVDLQNLKRTTYDRFLKLMNINFFSFAEILRLLVSFKAKEKSFRVVSISSLAAVRGDKTNHMYSASKAAMDAFIRSISLELNDKNVEINTIQPAFVDTPMAEDQKNFHAENFDNWIHGCQPLGIIPTSEVVELIRFFLEKKGNKMTGVSLVINAGQV